MARSTPIQEELSALQAELRTTQKAESRRHAEPREQPEENIEHVRNTTDELEAQLGDLGDALSGYAGHAEGFIAKHPLVSILTAFALGVAIGRLVGRD